MSEIDNIIQLSTETSTPSSNIETAPVELPSPTISDDDLNETINENSEDSFEENQVEATNFDAESLLEEAREEFNEALDEVAPTDTEEPREEENTEDEDEIKRIPLNSPTFLIDESTTRFSGTEWYKEIQKASIIIAGVGGIGGNLAFQISRMIPAKMVLYDDDNVEMVNMAGQLYSYNDLGKAKVNAIADMIAKYTAMHQVIAIKDKFTSETEPGDIMMCGFDNMRARRIFFDSWCKHLHTKSDEERAKCLFLDGRLSIDTLQIFCIRGDDEYNLLRYKREFLFNDYEAESTVCSMKQTTYLACMIGSLMTNLFTNFIANTLSPIIPYDLPFFTEYDAQNMLFKTES